MLTTMNEHLRPEEPTPESSVIHIRFGDEIVTFSANDTMIRQFKVGDGEYDHCVKIVNGKLFAFTPTTETMEALKALGCPIRVDAEPDAATLAHHSVLLDSEWQQVDWKDTGNS